MATKDLDSCHRNVWLTSISRIGDSQYLVVIVYLDASQSAEYSLTEQEWGLLVADDGGSDVLEVEITEVNALQVDDGADTDVSVGINKSLASDNIAA